MPRLGLVCPALLVLLCVSLPASAQERLGVLQLGRWTGSLEGDYEADRDYARSGPGQNTDYSLRQARESLTVRNAGWSVVDETLMTGSLSLTMGRYQEHQRQDGVRDSDQGSLAGYGFDTTLLGASPYAASFYANRARSFLTHTFGRNDVSYDDAGAIFRFGETSFLRDRGLPYFSSNLRLDRQHVEQNTVNALGQSFQTDEIRRRLGYDGHNGFQTSDLDWSYAVDDVGDPALARNNSRTQSVGLNYSLDFGPTLNRRWDSRIAQFHRTGATEYTSWLVNEKLHIDHRSNLSSDYNYAFNRIGWDGWTTTTQNATAGVAHQLNRNLNESVQFAADHTALPSGSIEVGTARLDVGYRRGLPGGGTLSMRVADSQQLHKNRLTSSQVKVTDEAHGAPTPLGAGNGFALGNANVTQASIVVVDTRNGARLPTVPGIDYDLVFEGNQTRIVPLLMSSVIQAGDPLAVSYAYQLDPSIKYRTAGGSFSVGLDYGWISVTAGHEETSQKLLEGQESQFLDEVRSDTAALDLRTDWKGVRAQGGVAFLKYDSTRLIYDQRRAYVFSSYRPWRLTEVKLTGNRTVTDYTLPERQSDLGLVRLSLERLVAVGWSTMAMISRRVYRDSQQETETVNEATLNEKFDYGKLRLSSAVTMGRQTRGAFQTTNWRLDLSMMRAF